MAQIFSQSANLWFKLVVLALVLVIVAATFGGGMLYRSSFLTRVGTPIAQPVPFSHKHHVSELGIDCRYCHTSVEKSAFAGIPPTSTCMTCHSQVWTNALILEPVRASYRDNRPLPWSRVHDLPDFVYFDHSIHARSRVGCVACHGHIEKMPITWKAHSLEMRWCLKCHKDPVARSRTDEAGIDRKEGLPDLFYTALTAQEASRFDTAQLQNCSTCHR